MVPLSLSLSLSPYLYHISTDNVHADTMRSICEDWKETSDRASSNLRIYCRDGEDMRTFYDCTHESDS
jgi:hypothetical protein